MAKTIKSTPEEQVAAYFHQLNHPLAQVALALRKVILAADDEVGEQIKWNSPSFYYTGEMKAFDPKTYNRDIVVFNLHKKDTVLLIFPTGAKVNDQTGLLTGTFTDGRKIITFATADEVKNKEKDLQTVIKAWIKLVDK